MKQIKKAVIPIAGFGTRFLPITKAIPKGMLPIIDKPAIEYIVQELIDAGITDILFVESGQQQAVKDYFSINEELEQTLIDKNKLKELEKVKSLNSLANISFTMQLERKGTGGAVSCARDFIGNDPFVVVYCDDMIVSETPAISSLINSYNENGDMAVGTILVPASIASKFGVVKTDNDGNFKDYIEKPIVEEDVIFNAIVGRYLLVPEIFEYLDKLEPHYEGEIYLMDAVLLMMQDSYKMKITTIDGKYHDLGNKTEFVKTIIDFALKRDDLKDEILNHIKEVI